MNVGYEKAYLMQNGTNTTVSEIISTYVYKVGLQTAQYSFATAVGLFNSVVTSLFWLSQTQLQRRPAISVFSKSSRGLEKWQIITLMKRKKVK